MLSTIAYQSLKAVLLPEGSWQFEIINAVGNNIRVLQVFERAKQVVKMGDSSTSMQSVNMHVFITTFNERGEDHWHISLHL